MKGGVCHRALVFDPQGQDYRRRCIEGYHVSAMWAGKYFELEWMPPSPTSAGAASEVADKLLATRDESYRIAVDSP